MLEMARRKTTGPPDLRQVFLEFGLNDALGSPRDSLLQPCVREWMPEGPQPQDGTIV